MVEKKEYLNEVIKPLKRIHKEIDLQYIRENAPSDAVPLVFTNLGDHHLELLKLGKVNAGDEIIRVK